MELTHQMTKKLTEDELRLLQLISDGYTNRRMANALRISVRTIEARRAKIILKTKTTNTATLIKYAVRNNLVN